MQEFLSNLTSGSRRPKRRLKPRLR